MTQGTMVECAVFRWTRVKARMLSRITGSAGYCAWLGAAAIVWTTMTLSIAASETHAGQPSVQDVTDRVIEIFIAPDVRNSKRGFPWDRPKRVQFLGHVSEPVREAFREKLAELGEITGEAITYGDDDANIFVIDVQQIRELKAEDLPRRNKSFIRVGGMLPDVHPFLLTNRLAGNGMWCRKGFGGIVKGYVDARRQIAVLFYLDASRGRPRDILEGHYKAFIECLYQSWKPPADPQAPSIFDATSELYPMTCLDQASLRTWADPGMRAVVINDRLEDFVQVLAQEALDNRLEYAQPCQ